jgi:phosphoglycolate phosphatase-like HAD superfamily hydrolase
VLFDIDGTLLWSDGAGRRAMEAALTTFFGTSGRATFRYDGKTDRQIVRELMREAGYDDSSIDERMEHILRVYVERLDVELAAPGKTVRALAGVTELLDALALRSEWVVGLLTGNVEPGAVRKLRAAGIATDRFSVGAFGSDHEEREALPEIARVRARERLGLDFPGEALVIIGDTPNDVHCGRAFGARAIAVATGHYAVAELKSHEPCAVFADLSDTAAVIEAIEEA